MPIYRISGALTGTIAPENVAAAQAYLVQDDDMALFFHMWEAWAKDVVEHVEWKLDHNGHNWSVTAFATRELTDEEQRVFSEWVSGQNSDGMGEGFEQQDFAWQEQDDCTCDGDGWGSCDCAGGHMISFDWKDNEHKVERVK